MWLSFLHKADSARPWWPGSCLMCLFLQVLLSVCPLLSLEGRRGLRLRLFYETRIFNEFLQLTVVVNFAVCSKTRKSSILFQMSYCIPFLLICLGLWFMVHDLINILLPEMYLFMNISNPTSLILRSAAVGAPEALTRVTFNTLCNSSFFKWATLNLHTESPFGNPQRLIKKPHQIAPQFMFNSSKELCIFRMPG